MIRHLIAAFLAGTCLASPALAGDEVLYGDIPAWVEQADIADVTRQGGPAERLRDWQYRIEHSVVYAYADRAVRIDNPQALMQENQISLAWLPDKGDLTVHRLEIRRAGEVIDLLAQGVTFEVIRREQGLEDRLIDGELTATLSVPGLREGDVLRTAFSISTDDQALGDEVQVTQFLPTAPWQVEQARAIVSWPESEEMFWSAEERVALAEPVTRAGYRYLEVELPLAEPAPVPEDAPSRYQRPSILRVGSFSGWSELSAVMAPHYEAGASIAATSPVRAQAEAIMARTTDPLGRAALATQLVQDEVSYLLNGLDGGNYLPQSADETWERRFGDCKAKSVLLVALLRAMGIEAEPALVSSQAGDIVAEVLPLPASFDHVIVRAVIGGTDYWLDGTSTATRLATIADVPPFFYALPLRPEGAGLMPMVQRDPAVAQFAVTGEADHSAGVDLPVLVDVKITITGPAGAQIRSMVDADNPEILRQLARNFNDGSMEGVAISSLSLAYDDDSAVATIHLQGVGPSEFEFTDGRLRMNLNDMSQYAGFNPDRARASWRDIPVATMGPGRRLSTMRMILPDGGEGYVLEGEPVIEGGFGNFQLRASAKVQEGVLETSAEEIYRLGEIAPDALAQTKRAARRLAGYKLALATPQNPTWRWQRDPRTRDRLAAPIRAAYARAIAFAAEDDFSPLQARAQFNASIYDFAAAKADYDLLVHQSPSAWAYMQRANMLEALGETDAAIADLRTAYDLEPYNSLAFDLARLLAYKGAVAEAQELLSSLPVGEDEVESFADALATVSGLEGDPQAGLDVLADRIAATPQNAAVLNSDCWFRGLFSVALEDALARCTQAVERAQYPAAALDSRAMVHYRLGDMAGAIRDLDAALELAPGLAPSLYLRGIVRLQNGDRSGRSDVETALRIEPKLSAMYARHGIDVPK